MLFEETVGIVKRYLMDQGQGLEQQIGPGAASVAQDIRRLLGERLERVDQALRIDLDRHQATMQAANISLGHLENLANVFGKSDMRWRLCY